MPLLGPNVDTGESIDEGARFIRTFPYAAAAVDCAGCGFPVDLDEALCCVNAFHAVAPTGRLIPFPRCGSVYHVKCYRCSEEDWPTVLTDATHKDSRGRCARRADAICRNFLCEVCRVRSMCGDEAEGSAGDRARELERVRLLTLWAASTNSTIEAVATGRRQLMRLDALLPRGCLPAVSPFVPFWPLPRREITLEWHQLSLYPWGGHGEFGQRSVDTIKKLSGVLFNEHRERGMEASELIRLPNSKLLAAAGSSPTDSVLHEQFVRGLTTTLGTRANKAWPMPPAVARAIEAALMDGFNASRSVWGKYEAAMARLALVQMYSCFLRGNEPWKQKWKDFMVQPYLTAACPQCGHSHALLVIGERTKTSERPFTLAIATPVTGAGLQSLRAMQQALQMRAKVERLLQARGIRSEYLFVNEEGKVWTNDDFRKRFILPELRRLQVQRHPGLVGVNLSDARVTTIRMIRRGGEIFVKKAKVDPDLVDLMGRWRPKQQNREPTIMRQRYYEMTCEDCHLVTSARPPVSRVGFCAWHEFERVI